MNAIQILKNKLTEIIKQEESTDVETLAGYIVGELLGDYDGTYAELNESNATVQRIGELAADLERSNGDENQLAAMWDELKSLTNTL